MLKKSFKKGNFQDDTFQKNKDQLEKIKENFKCAKTPESLKNGADKNLNHLNMICREITTHNDFNVNFSKL